MKKNAQIISRDSHKLIKVNRKSTLIGNQLKICFGSEIYIDEIINKSSEFSDESNEDKINKTPLTSSFKIILSETDDNYLVFTLNNIAFGGKLTAEYIRYEICDFIIKK